MGKSVCFQIRQCERVFCGFKQECSGGRQRQCHGGISFLVTGLTIIVEEIVEESLLIAGVTANETEVVGGWRMDYFAPYHIVNVPCGK